MPQEIADDWVNSWLEKKSLGDAAFLARLKQQYQAFRAGGEKPRAAIGATIRQHPIFADIKV